MRPSALLDIKDPYVAYCLDEAVVYFADKIMGELDKITHKNADHQQAMRMQKLNVLLGEKPKFATPEVTKRTK